MTASGDGVLRPLGPRGRPRADRLRAALRRRRRGDRRDRELRARRPACHAYVGLTPRTATLFGPPGRAYVYLSYGIHSLLNAVAEPEGSAAAVLIRALEPTARDRRDARAGAAARAARELCSGPGKLTEALGDRARAERRLARRAAVRAARRRAASWERVEVATGPRIGITKATELPWRFCAAGSRFLSRPLPLAA